MEAAGHTVIDLGTNSTAPVDYPDYAEKLGRAILAGPAEHGILIRGSGVGASGGGASPASLHTITGGKISYRRR